MRSDDLPVLRHAAQLIEEARKIVPWYAGRSSPTPSGHVAELLRHSGCVVEIFPFLSDSTAMVPPPILGVHVIFMDRKAARVDRQFALRHELAHVLARETEFVFMADADYMGPAERTADLFALADVVPGWWIRQVRGVVRSWKRTRDEVRIAIAGYADGWPPDRLDDRAQLRVSLYKEATL